MANLTDNNTKTSFHINNFWFHVKWEESGKKGRDQHGDLWLNREEPIHESGAMQPDRDGLKAGKVPLAVWFLLILISGLTACSKSQEDVLNIPPAPMPKIHFVTDSTNR